MADRLRGPQSTVRHSAPATNPSSRKSRW
jgi:hypothetical protein